MTKKEFKKTDSKGREEIWEWEETSEMRKAVERLHQTIRENKLRELELKAPNKPNSTDKNDTEINLTQVWRRRYL